MKKLIMVVVMALCGTIAAGNAHALGESQSVGEKFILAGVIYRESGGGLAYLQEPTLTKNAIVAVRPGGKIGPYKLTKIFEDRVELEGPSGTIVVPIHGGGAGTVATAGSAPAKPAGNETAQPPAAEGGTPTPNVLQKIYAGNPNVHYFPVGSPNRNQGFNAIFSAMPRGK